MEDRPTTPLNTADRMEVKVRFDPSMISSESSEKSLGKQNCLLRSAKASLPYVGDLLLLLSAVATVLATRELGPAGRGFFCHDPSISYPYREDSVTVTVLALLTVLLPPAVMLPIELVQQRRGLAWSFSRPLWKVAVLSWRHIVCQAFLLATTEVIKCLVSRPRPSFMDVCRPTDYNQTLCEERRFISEFECGSLSPSSSHYERLLVVDFMMSFPSGHAAISCCTATFMAVYLSSRSAGRRRTVLRSWLVFCCVMYGSVVAFSRVADHRHHLGDVLAGAALGAAAALLLCYCVCPSMFNKAGQGRPLLPQSSVVSNRTIDTQVTTLEDEL